MATADNNVLSLLQKVKNLMENAGTPDEAAAAASRLTALLTKHNLTIESLNLESDSKPTYSRVLGQVGKVHWKRSLLSAIVKYNFCFMVWYRGRETSDIIGSPENLKVVVDLYSSSVRIIESLGERGYVEYLKECRINGVREPLHGREFKTSFYMGAVHGFGEAMRLANEQTTAETDNGSALAIRVMENLEEAAKEIHGEFNEKLGKKNSKALAKAIDDLNPEAYMSGHKQGRKMNTKVAQMVAAG